MKDKSLFETNEFEKLTKALDLACPKKINSTGVHFPDRDYLMAWNFGYVPGEGENSTKTL